MRPAPAVRTVHLSIANPFRQGQRVRLPSGTPVLTTNPAHAGRPIHLRRTHTVRLVQVADGWVDLWGGSGNGVGFVHLPTATWAGSGGYWHEVKATPELCRAVGVPVPALPDVSADYHRLDIEPCYGPGYDDRLG